MRKSDEGNMDEAMLDDGGWTSEGRTGGRLNSGRLKSGAWTRKVKMIRFGSWVDRMRVGAN